MEQAPGLPGRGACMVAGACNALKLSCPVNFDLPAAA
jgi:hypothetical protein